MTDSNKTDIFPMRVIAHIRSDFPEKFGIPRQSGLVETLEASVIFEPPFRNPEALRGLEGFSHIWLIWVFDQAIRENWSATVRPPRLGGNRRMGVFATRSPFRPNPIAISCVTLSSIEITPQYGAVLHIRGADLMDGTPILDIKPYLPYTDCRPNATGTFMTSPSDISSFNFSDLPTVLKVNIPPSLLERLPEGKRETLQNVLAQDPRPHYQNDPTRLYGFTFAGFEIQFTVMQDSLTVQNIFIAGEK